MLPWRVGMPTEDFTDVTLAGLVGEDTVEHDVPDGPDNSDGPDNPHDPDDPDDQDEHYVT